MEKRLAKDFNNKVDELIHNAAVRLRFFEVLKTFHRVQDVPNFVNELKGILCEPKLLPLFEDIRPLVPVHLQLEYDDQIPVPPSNKLRHVTLQCQPNLALGFSVRGGLEHGVGVYVSEVLIGSQAEGAGLGVGDELVTVEGYSVSQATHQEVLALVRNRSEIEITLRYVGILPVKDSPDEKVTWKFVKQEKVQTVQEVAEGCQVKDIQLSIILPVGASLGCSICSGPTDQPGVFIHSVKVGGLAEEAGLEVGDQVIDVNGVDCTDITHSQAIVALKGSRMLNLTVRKKAGFSVFGLCGTPPIDTESQPLEKEKKSTIQKPTLQSSKNVPNSPNSAPKSFSKLAFQSHKTRSTSSEIAFNSKKSTLSSKWEASKKSQTLTSPTWEKPSSSQKSNSSTKQMISLNCEDPALIPNKGSSTDLQKTGVNKHSSKVDKSRPRKDMISDLQASSSKVGSTSSQTRNNMAFDVVPPESFAGTEETVCDSNTGTGSGTDEFTSKQTKMEVKDTNKSINKISDSESGKQDRIKLGKDSDTDRSGRGTGERYTEVLEAGGTEQTEKSCDLHGIDGQKRVIDAREMEEQPNKKLEKNPLTSEREPTRSVFTASHNPEVTKPLSVDTTKTQVEDNTKAQSVQPKVSPMAGTYMTDRQNPSFRIQKPVLLHPTRPVSVGDRMNTVGCVPEEMDSEWTPYRLFTNEQIAGRQVQLITIHKSCDWKDMGISLETHTLRLGRTGLVVSHVTPGSPIHKQGGAHCGDELLMVNAHSVLDIDLSDATKLLQEEYTKAKKNIQLVVAKALPSDSTEQVTYF